MEAQLWGPALLLARFCGEPAFTETAAAMADAEVRQGTPLHALLSVLAGSAKQSSAGTLPPPAPVLHRRHAVQWAGRKQPGYDCCLTLSLLRATAVRRDGRACCERLAGRPGHPVCQQGPRQRLGHDAAGRPAVGIWKCERCLHPVGHLCCTALTFRRCLSTSALGSPG